MPSEDQYNARIAQRHIEHASRLLMEAMHYHRFFGRPNAQFSDGFNRDRAEATDRLVRSLSSHAGTYFAYASKMTPEPVLWEQAQATMKVARIRDSFQAGVARATGDV